MSSESDSQLDARMRDVPPPDGLLDRLRAIAEPSDAEMDRQLRDVAIPFGLVARLSAAVADEAIDERLVDVPVPVTVLGRLRRVPQSRWQPSRRLSRVGRLALAASLMILLGGSYLAGLAAMLDHLRPQPPSIAAIELPFEPPLEIESGFVYHVQLEETEGPVQRPAVVKSIAVDFPAIPFLQQPRLPQPGPAGVLWRDIRHVRLDEDVFDLQFHDLVYTHHTDDDLPELEPSPEPLTGNLEPPMVASGFDRRAFYYYGVFPPVQPGADPSLRQSHPPLSTSTESIERLRRAVSRLELPPKEDIRVEDFLAAVDYQFAPARAGRLELRTSGGPSVFGDQGAGLLQVGVKAGAAPRTDRQGVHLIVALDVSASMRWRGRIDVCKQGLRRALAHLEPRDCFSLVAFDGEVVDSVEGVSGDQVELAYRLLDDLHPQGGTNLAEGIQHAISLGLSETKRSARVLLITDGPGEMPAPLTDAVNRMLASAAADGVTLSVIEMADGPEIDPQLEQLAAEGAGLFYRAATSQHVLWTAVETLTGRSSLTAADAELEVTFNPRCVEAYRLLGHERTTLADDAPATITADLHGGEEVAVLYEVWLKPNGDDNVATARVHWRDPATGKSLSSPPQPITRVQFALSFERSALSLQTACIAAEAAEVLRESRFAPRSRNLSGVLEMAERVSPLLAERPAFRDFIGLLEDVERVRTHRSGVSP